MTQRAVDLGRSHRRQLLVPALGVILAVTPLLWGHVGPWWPVHPATAQGVAEAVPDTVPGEPEPALAAVEPEWDPEWNVPAVPAARVPSVAEQVERVDQVMPEAFSAQPGDPPDAVAPVDAAVEAEMDNLTAQRERVLAGLEDDPPPVDIPTDLPGPPRMDAAERDPDSLAAASSWSPPPPAQPPIVQRWRRATSS